MAQVHTHVSVFGSFGLSTKEPYTIVLRLLSSASALASSSVHTSPYHRVIQELHIWYRYALMSLIYAHQIFSDSDLLFLNSGHFGSFL